MELVAYRSFRVLLLLLVVPVCFPERSPAQFEDEVDDRRVAKAHGFKIWTNEQRMSIDERDPPAVVYVFMKLTTPFEDLELRLPPGFRMVPEALDPDAHQDVIDKRGVPVKWHHKNVTGSARRCGIYAVSETAALAETPEAKEFNNEKHPRDLPEHIDGCHVYESEEKKFGKHGDEMVQVHVRMKLKKGVPDLSKRLPAGDLDKNADVWWSFALHVRNPKLNPTDEDNWFALQHYLDSGTWNGLVYHRGWPIKGDWACKYSDWEGWGQCSARCGGGIMKLTRRLLSIPPPRHGHFRQCTEDLVYEKICNDFACKFPCELVDAQKKDLSVCSSECGGGVKARRWIWRGDGCPAQDDKLAVSYEQCNPEPCRARCKLADTWTVVTGCSEMCGQGTYRMMRQVLVKDNNDPACQPEWREVKCARQWCTQLTIIRPDRNILPYPEDTYYVGIAFKLTFAAQKVTLTAPIGYSFGVPGASCFLHDHDLFPFYAGCKVGLESPDGSYVDARSLTILLDGLLPRNDAGRYHFMVAVTNPPCPHNDFRQVGTVDDVPGGKEVCFILPIHNMWSMQFTKETVKEGHSPILPVWAGGYELHNPKESSKQSPPGGKEMFWKTTNDGQFVTMQDERWQTRLIYCSARLEPCPNGQACPPSGVCPPTTDGQDPGVMDDGNEWTLNDEESIAESDQPSTSEIDQEEAADYNS